MKMKKILASLAAAALAVSAMGVAAFAEAEEPATTFEGSATIVGENWWAEKEVSVAELIGDLNPDDVKTITFTCADHDFTVGYNSADTWVQSNAKAGEELVCDDILLKTIAAPTEEDPDAMRDPALKVCISADDGKDYVISWVASTLAADPEESDPTESDPTESDPTESDPTESEPTGSDPTESDPAGSDPAESDPAGSDPAASESATTTSGVAGNVNGGDNGDKNQPTGLVLAVVPAAVAAAAVVISKKRK